jgi:hypothetical protein
MNERKGQIRKTVMEKKERELRDKGKRDIQK